jgi:hypothetical protein
MWLIIDPFFKMPEEVALSDEHLIRSEFPPHFGVKLSQFTSKPRGGTFSGLPDFSVLSITLCIEANVPCPRDFNFYTS